MDDRSSRRPISEIEAELVAREKSPEAVADVFDEFVRSADSGGRARTSWSVTRKWYAVNGDVERQHTTGTFVRSPKAHGSLPTLVVYVDSRARMVDFQANREIYRARMEQVGLRFEDVEFRVSKWAKGAAPRPVTHDAPPVLPELSPEESSWVDRMTSELPEKLKLSVSRAMRVTMQAEKRRNS